MKRLIAVAGLMFFFGSQPTSAQPYRQPTAPYVRPPVSPYLNLLRRGGNPAINYYGLVRPQQEFMNALQQLQQPYGPGQPYAGYGDPALTLPITGHTSQFMNFSHYYGRRIGGPAASRPALIPPAVVPLATAPLSASAPATPIPVPPRTVVPPPAPIELPRREEKLPIQKN